MHRSSIDDITIWRYSFPMASFPQGDKMIGLVARRFRMLGEPYRLHLLRALESGDRTVGELVVALDGNQPNISKHLQMLHDAGLVSRRREGTSIYYGIADPMVFRLCQLVCRSAAERAREEYDEMNAETIPSVRIKKAAKR
ncbi:MAG: ArsR/SmtB family transcription factor [Acidobacteriaceae bacterium]